MDKLSVWKRKIAKEERKRREQIEKLKPIWEALQRDMREAIKLKEGG